MYHLGMLSWRESQLVSLAWHWGTAFVIRDGGSEWTAIPFADQSVTLRADSPVELREAMRTWYLAEAIRRRDRAHVMQVAESSSL